MRGRRNKVGPLVLGTALTWWDLQLLYSCMVCSSNGITSAVKLELRQPYINPDSSTRVNLPRKDQGILKQTALLILQHLQSHLPRRSYDTKSVFYSLPPSSLG